MRFRVVVNPNTLHYCVDHLAVYEITENDDVDMEVNEKIDMCRKQNFNLT